MTTTLETPTQFDSRRYIEENSFRLNTQGKVSSRLLRCIDDRSPRKEAENNPYASPGGALGGVIDVMAASYEVLGESSRELNPRKLFGIAKTAIADVVTFHTDTHAVGFACAGCGYLAASLRDGADNFFSHEAAEFLKGEAVETCKKELEMEGLDIASYDCAHCAKAVVVIQSLDIGVYATGHGGDHVYVYHPLARNAFLEKVATAIYPEVQALKSELTLDGWKEQVLSIADRRLQNVMRILGADKLLMVMVSEVDGEIVSVEV